MQKASLQIQKDVLLKPYTTFKIGGFAKFFAHCTNLEDLKSALLFAKEHNEKVLIISGSSNMLIADAGFNGLVISMEILGKEVVEEQVDKVKIKVLAGENWDELVKWACTQELWGLENLSHIPGKTGAAVVQNIGAYGAQIADTIDSVEVLEIATGEIKNFSNSECGFGYRRSIFNKEQKGQYVILSVVFTLSRKALPHLKYTDLQIYFKENLSPSVSEIRNAVIEIRNKKFPFPTQAKDGNAGSFFKNVLINKNNFSQLEEKIKLNFGKVELEKLKFYEQRSENSEVIKIPTAFLIEICGWKGKELGGVKVNESQSLVLLNMGSASAVDVLALAKTIRQNVHAKTGIALEIEPELVGFSETELNSLYAL
jgi:UDP-N-acetylmuramate dehydrogenase